MTISSQSKLLKQEYEEEVVNNEIYILKSLANLLWKNLKEKY